MNKTFGVQNWAMIGNDYVCPRVSNAYAKKLLRRSRKELVFWEYVPFGSDRLANAVDGLGLSGAQGVLVSLVVQDAASFNRAFRGLELQKRMFRLSCTIEENNLLASGAGNVDRPFAAAFYFAGLDTDDNRQAQAKYHALHPERAPTLNALGQSTYEGIQFLARLMASSGDWRSPRSQTSAPVVYRSVRQSHYVSNDFHRSPVYLARADGLIFNGIERLS